MSETARLIVPPPGPLHPSEQDFSKGLKWSVLAHIAVAALIVVKSLVFPSRTVTYIPALRVDIVGLPDVLKGERYNLAKAPPVQPTQEEKAKQLTDSLTNALKKAETEAKKVKAAKPVEQASPDEMVLKPRGAETEAARKKRMSGALARIKALAKVSGEPDTRATAGQLIKGNRISRGTSLSGDARESAQASYYDTLREKLQENWALPVWIARQQLSAQVQIHVDARGQLHGYRFIKLSGNAQFDDAVKKTLVLSQPFPVPPSGLERSVLMDGILVGFPL